MQWNDLIQLSEQPELQIVNLRGEKVSGFFNISVFTHFHLSRV